jgi:AraC-like DNA-binding protein
MATVSADLEDGHVIPEHSHPEDQLLFASEGVMTVRTKQGVWVVPPMRAVWIPAETFHSVATSGLIEMIIDHLKAVESVPLQLPRPVDPRAQRVVARLVASPGEHRKLEKLCRECGASKRTIQRLFREETKMTFSRWRQQLRLLHAMQLLASGEKVTAAALDADTTAPVRSSPCSANNLAKRQHDIWKGPNENASPTAGTTSTTCDLRVGTDIQISATFSLSECALL